MNYLILSNRRKEIGMSIDALVERSGVPRGTVTKIITGVTDNPGIETLKSITYALGLTLEDLDENSTASSKVLSVDESELVTIYRDLNATGQATLMNMARSLNMNPDMKGGSASSITTA